MMMMARDARFFDFSLNCIKIDDDSLIWVPSILSHTGLFTDIGSLAFEHRGENVTSY